MKDMFHALLILGVIIPLIIAVLYGLKYALARPLSFNNKTIRITQQLSIGAKERLLYIEVEGTHLLLGVTPHAITTLHVLHNKEQA